MDELEQVIARIDSVRDMPAESDTGTSPPAVVEPSEDPFALADTNWLALIRDGVPKIDYLYEPYIAKGARVWLWGATGTAKSIYALWSASNMSKQGTRVSYFSEENPTTEDLRRLALLKPDPAYLRWFHRTRMDLTDPRWVESMLTACDGDEAVFLDTWTDLWHGDESSNEAVRDFDANVLKPLQAQGATPIIVHHTGHPQMFGGRKGATAGRGASSLGQKADVTLEFKAEQDGAFTIVYGKPRIGGAVQPDRTFRVVDVEDEEAIDIIEVGGAHERAVQELADNMAEAILNAPDGYLTTSHLRTVVGGGAATQTEALALLDRSERVSCRVERVQAQDGRHRNAKTWRPVGSSDPSGLFT
jgi:hypothetical protein